MTRKELIEQYPQLFLEIINEGGYLGGNCVSIEEVNTRHQELEEVYNAMMQDSLEVQELYELYMNMGIQD